MCVPIFNEIHESVSELSFTQVKMFGSHVMEVKPVYSRLFIWRYMKYIQTELLGVFNALRYIINLLSNALPFNENEKMIKHRSFMWFKIYYSCLMSLPWISKVQIKKIIK